MHRDLKPGNVLVDRRDVPRLLDFGQARPFLANESVTPFFVGTLAYASPEHIVDGPIDCDPRSDVYSLGVVLFQLLTGSLPYDVGNSLASAVRVIVGAKPTDARRIRPDLPDALVSVTRRALRKRPDARYPSAVALAADLRRWLDAGAPARRPRPQ